MTSLENILRIETADFKTMFLDMREQWAKSKFKQSEERKEWSVLDWCNHFNISPKVLAKGTRSEFNTFPATETGKQATTMCAEVKSICALGLAKYMAGEIKKANDHYESSLLKLAFRIEQKGLNIESMKAISGRVGVNIEITLSDNVKTVKAWTIIAEGEIQRPHYRYLIK